MDHISIVHAPFEDTQGPRHPELLQTALYARIDSGLEGLLALEVQGHKSRSAGSTTC